MHAVKTGYVADAGGIQALGADDDQRDYANQREFGKTEINHGGTTTKAKRGRLGDMSHMK